jgi:cytochrome c biogenesis protein CcmG/thiol:disulfide interchange protein DsbE
VKLALRRAGAGICLLAAGLIVWSAGLPDRVQTEALFGAGLGSIPVAPEVGALAPPVEAMGIDGEWVSLAAWRGDPVIVNFWATWCAPCAEELPLLDALAHDGRARVVAINAGEPAADILTWAAAHGLAHGPRFALVVDHDGRLERLYRVRGLPATFFVDAAGLVRDVVYGPLTAARLDAALDLVAP